MNQEPFRPHLQDQSTGNGVRVLRLPFLGFLFILAVGSLTGCLLSRDAPERFYYTLLYEAETEKEELRRTRPFPDTAWITEASLISLYRRKQIVQRHAGPRISYMDNHLWANDLEAKIPALIATRLEAYRLFNSLSGKDSYSRPDLEITTFIDRLEYHPDEQSPEALFSLRLELRELQGPVLVTTREEARYPLKTGEGPAGLEAFVDSINKGILSATDRFARDIINYYGARIEEEEREEEEDS